MVPGAPKGVQAVRAGQYDPRSMGRLGGLAAPIALCFGLLPAWCQPVVSDSQPVPQSAPSSLSGGFVPDGAAPFLPWDAAWPARWKREPTGLQGVGRSLDVEVTTLRPLRPARVRPPTADDVADFELLAGRAAPDKSAFELEGSNSVLFSPVAGARRRGLGSGPGPDAGPAPASVFRFISGQLERETGAPGTDERPVKIQRTWFAYYEPVGEKIATGRASAPPIRATVLLMPGIFGNPEPTLDPLVLALRRRGYAVLRMLCQPSRFTEYVLLEVHPDELESSARKIARQFDNRTAECAYAAQGAWAFVEQHRPAIRDLPCLVVGLSGGAITLPTVVAREPKRYCGAVLIGGAADYWLTSQRSNYREMIGATAVVWKGEGRSEQLERRLDGLYLQAARLDSFHTAAALHGMPVLVLQGLADRAVPSALGDVLWERLKRPERWTYPLGHEMLFAGLPAEFPRLLDWLDGVVEKAGRPGNGPP